MNARATGVVLLVAGAALWLLAPFAPISPFVRWGGVVLGVSGAALLWRDARLRRAAVRR